MNGGASNPSPTAWRQWLDRFRSEHGRAPRILHIGNIANNAWNNAKVLNQAGFVCDVLCHDYYHIMGCPEWEDADFRGVIRDQFNPDWSAVDRRGFDPPPWFAQGPRTWCIRFLVARRLGQRRRAALWRLLLERSRRGRLRRAVRAMPFLRDRILGSARPRRLLRGWWSRVTRRDRPLGRRLLWAASLPLVAAAVVAAAIVALPRWFNRRDDGAPGAADPFERRVSRLIAEFDARFPDRPDRLRRADFSEHRSAMPLWMTLFAHYDLIEAYSTDTVWPMLAGVPYVAYEHGTIREIPFQDDAVGRLTALGYALADYTVITNPDCREAAVRLGVRRMRFVPHLIDRKYYDAAIQCGPLPAGLRAPFIFCPARHDWAVKGTGILLRAFASVAAEHPDLRLLMSAWGADLDRSRACIAESGLADRVTFGGPYHIHDLIRVTARAAAIVDQFRYGVFGGIGPTALAVGTPLVTHLDRDKYGWCVDSEPPYHEAFDEPSCAAAIDAALRSGGEPERRRRLDWMRRNYWHGEVVDRHASIYMTVLEGSRSDGLREPFPPRKRLPEPLTGAVAT